jgi:DNA-binding MarR family transcriptional regulator
MDQLDRSGTEPATRRDADTRPKANRSGKPRSPRRGASSRPAPGRVVDLERYVPAFLTWIANKLSRGASQHYLAAFGVGIEVWRCLVLLAIEDRISAQHVSRIVGMDKASVSRCFKSMQADGLITLGLDDGDGRVRIAKLTRKGRMLHDKILGIALERERVFLSVLTNDEQEALIGLLKRLHANLPQVDEATATYVAAQFPKLPQRARPRRPGDEDE